MKIKKNSIVTLHYTLTNKEGTVIETTRNGAPIQLICGAGLFLRKFESALIGLEPMCKTTIIISAEDGYGKIDKKLILRVPSSTLPEIDTKVGKRLWRCSSGGEKISFKITGFLGDWVFLDGNHPLAGVELHYNIFIISVNDNKQLYFRVP